MPRTATLDRATRDLFGLSLAGDEAAYIDDRYRVLRPLGEGAFATVLLCADERRRGRLVAVKGVRTLSLGEQRSLMHEFVNARRLRHPNLVSVLDIGVSARHGVYLVLEYVDGPDLVTILEQEGTLPVDVAAEVCRQVARGLANMHRRGLVHRDVKADNVYLEGANAKLGDFGASRVAHPGGKATVIFTPGYAPPETALGQVGPEADTYALGALFHLLVTGTIPPVRTTRMRRSTVSAAMRELGGARAEQLARRLLHPQPRQRLRDLTVIRARMKAMVRPGTRRRLKALVESANLRRQRAELEKRWAEFEQRFVETFKPFGLEWVCVSCQGPASEGMLFCPWCGDLLRFRSAATFPRYCARCEHGIHDEWECCAWCGERYLGTDRNGARPTPDRRYEDRCTRCRGRMMRYMSFCPWCAESYTWHTRGMEDECGGCGFSVERNLFAWCPWCGQLLDEHFAEQARERIARTRRRR
jgi:hypothetical protein